MIDYNKEVSPINIQNLRSAFLASRLGGTRGPVMVYITEGETTLCRGFKSVLDPAVGMEMIWMIGSDGKHHLVDPSKDTIRYNDVAS
jgi:hypothetical protein